ncbi:type VI secretion system contractile sheath small subunit [Corallococcus sp. AB018]|uniref:type VI secretion system contractile sheath small subunit n=1 Tax=Corallococcus sp. AB018 TaxID=2316715 RepID=UPI0018F6BD1C|nr:type VI secretion system contractile sheath small subunit [Corallococcus sp. AB018]
MSSESKQHWLDRNRPPRVQITYDVETLGSAKKMELPLVVGILADLLGDTVLSDPLKQRKFVQIDRDTFDDFMGKLAPTLKLGGKAGPAGLTFKKMEDFEPLQIVKQAPQLSKLLRERQRLVDVVAQLSGNDSLNTSFQKVFSADSAALSVKKTQIQEQRQPFKGARDAAKTLTAKAQVFMERLEAVASVIHVAQQSQRVAGAFDHLTRLLPGEDLSELKTGDAAKLKTYREQHQGLLAPDASKRMEGAIQALEGAFSQTPPDDAVSAQAQKDLGGPAAGLKALTDLTAGIADPTKRAQALDVLRKIAKGASAIGDALKNLEEAPGVNAAEKARDEKMFEAAKDRIKKTSLANADKIIAESETFAKDPSKPDSLQNELKAAFPRPLPEELELSQVQVLLGHQQKIMDGAEARVIQAHRFMDARSQEKALAARDEARQVLETAEKLEGLVKVLDGSPPENPEQLESVHQRVEALRGAADAADAETRLQLEAFDSLHS